MSPPEEVKREEKSQSLNQISSYGEMLDANSSYGGLGALAFRQSVLSEDEIIEADENLLEPNAYIKQNPKEIFKLMANYCKEKEMSYIYKKNSYKFSIKIKMNNKYINLHITFEKGKKKSTKDLYRLKFIGENTDEED